MRVPLYTFQGEHVGTVELSDAVFNVKPNVTLLHEAVVAYAANSRQSVAHSKDRGEVRGGGKKPWKQKGTGRARHGSSRSPLWVGGGVTFGPVRNRDFSVKLNRKVARQALKMALSDRAHDQNLIVVDAYTLPRPKTKPCAAFIKKMCAQKRTLVLTDVGEKNVVRCFRNIPQVTVVAHSDVNCSHVLGAKKIVVSKDGITQLVSRLSTKV